MVDPTELEEKFFENFPLKRTAIGKEVDILWGYGANYISKDDLIHLLNGGVLADYSSGEYAFFYKLDKEALDFVKRKDYPNGRQIQGQSME